MFELGLSLSPSPPWEGFFEALVIVLLAALPLAMVVEEKRIFKKVQDSVSEIERVERLEVCHGKVTKQKGLLRMRKKQSFPIRLRETQSIYPWKQMALGPDGACHGTHGGGRVLPAEAPGNLPPLLRLLVWLFQLPWIEEG